MNVVGLARHAPAQRGVALLVVLWGCTLAAITLGALATNARIESLQARTQSLRTQAFYAAEAGIDVAVFHLSDADGDRRWQPDWQSHAMRVGDAEVSVSVSAEEGKLNLNLATPEQITDLLRAAGVDEERIGPAAKAIGAWGDPGEAKDTALLLRGGFTSLEELRRVPGLASDIVDRIEPALTLWTVQQPNLAYASPVVVAAVTGADAAAARAYVDRVSRTPMGVLLLPPLPGTKPGDASRSPVAAFNIVATATLKDGQAVTLDVVLFLKNDPGDPAAYRVVRWRERSSAGRG
ncbi:general secretion pathway protein GspK [Luteibacter flocculans]|uniref:General secretion pathway protein GspK n=1 Tax=Luteibacter flocculans TaxID=2780091 RepID=A0ABY4SYB3_9GAMM|nr:type II secretion system protein GspK [Luteibacter flocculans]URL57049.1 general secretion pathway protein GspK [Luteibacter flocculans]